MSNIPFDLMLQWTAAGYRALIPARGERLDPAQIVLEHMQRGDADLAQGEMFQLQLFVRHLGDVQRHRPDVFAGLQTRMYACAQADNYFGLRMEANIASTLARARVPFALQERPDFSVNDGELFLECSSVWPDTKKPERDYRARVDAALRKKAGQRYARTDTALAVEITSVMAAMVTHRRQPKDTDFHEFLENRLNASGYGSLLLFSITYSGRERTLESCYLRLDARVIDPRLRTFLEERFPLGDHRVYEPFTPGQRRKPV
jgi:hypothetical protein